MNPQHVCFKTRKQFLFVALHSLMSLGLLGVTGQSVQAADVSLTSGDGFGEHSFDSAGHWNSGAAPTGGNNYFTGAFICRSPNSGSSTITFGGTSLTISPGGALYQKLTPLVMTVNVLTNNGRVANAQGGSFTVLGNMYVTGNGGGMDTGSGNSSATDSRTITNGMTISGSATLTNYTADANWPNYSAAQGTVVYTGDNTAFTGRQVATRNTVISIASQANLGGNPDTFYADYLLLDNGVLRPTASFSLNQPNRGITIGAGGGKFDLAAGILFTNATALAGAGTLALTNTGTLVQAGTAANFTGTISVPSGTVALAVGGSLAGPNTISVGSAGTLDVSAAGITLASSQTLAGNGTVVGTVSAGTGSRISPGGAGVAANLTIGALTLTGNATLAYDFAGSTNDVIMVGGNLSPSGVTSLQLVNIPANNGVYTLITVGGTLGGSAANFNVAALSTRTKNFSVSYDTTSTPKRVLLTVSGSGSTGNLVWQGDTVSGVNNAWDINTSHNWLNGASSDVYYDSDSVSFTDTGAANQPTLDVTVNPASVHFNASLNYTLTGLGAIAGGTTLSKGGTSTVTLTLTNTYTGGTVVSNGVLKLGTVAALGNPAGATALATVTGTGTLDLNGMAVDATYTNAVRISGSGFSATQGAIDNTGGGMTSGSGDVGVNNLILTGDATVSAGAGQNWEIGNPGLGISGNGYVLTKIGDGYLYLRKPAVNALGGLVIAGGGVLFWDRADALGSAATITLTNSGFIDTWNPANGFNGLTFANPIVVGANGGAIFNIRAPGYNHPGYDIYNGSVTLNGTLVISNTAYYSSTPETYGKVTLNGNITGTGGVIVQGGTSHYVGSGAPEFYGGNLVVFNGNNSYRGLTLVTNLVRLQTSTANQSGGAYDVVDFATLDVAVAAGKPTLPMSSLVVESVSYGPANLGFTRLSTMPVNPVIYATNLTITAGVILPPLAGYAVGQFPLIKYGTISGSGFAGLQLGTLPAGVTASLVDNTANKTIDLLVTTVGVVWKGNVSSAWDLGQTANWYNPVSASAEGYADGETVVFDDTATRFHVDLTGAVQPGGITVNASQDYFFNGTNLAGSGVLIKNGSGTLMLSNVNNVFTGGTYINGGTVKLADQNYVYPYGGGALNNNLGNVNVANGGTLDVNAVQVPNFQSFGPEGYNVLISGAGVGGNGALVNNSTNNNDSADPGYVTLTADATVGGIGDVNIRHGVSPQLSSQSSDYTLTKVGSGQFRIRYLTAVSTNFGAINILQGIVSYESTSLLGFGDASKPVTIGNGGGFAWGTASTACQRALICSNNSTIYGYNSTSNVFAGPVTLVGGNVNLNANYYNGMTFSNVISGAGGLTLQYQGYATLAAANTYTGPTTVANCNAGNGSVLRLVGAGSIGGSSGITLQGITASQSLPGALDASGRTDGTLTLVSGQTLRGDNGAYVKGAVVAAAGTAITPGGLTNIQYLTFSNTLTLQAGSVVAMDVSLDGSVTNDLIKVTGAVNYGGTLQLTNSGTTALTNGATFKLFSAGSFTGNFASLVGTPGAGLGWSFNPTNGTATVVGTTVLNSTNITFTVAGNQLTLNWPADHLGWILQTQTNTLAAGLSTNWVDVPGSGAAVQSVITVSPAAPSVFFRLRSPSTP